MKEKKEKECRAFALPAHTLSYNRILFIVRLSSLERSDNDLCQDKHTSKRHFNLFRNIFLYLQQILKIIITNFENTCYNIIINKF